MISRMFITIHRMFTDHIWYVYRDVWDVFLDNRFELIILQSGLPSVHTGHREKEEGPNQQQPFRASASCADRL